jgi:hypothetical protein
MGRKREEGGEGGEWREAEGGGRRAGRGGCGEGKCSAPGTIRPKEENDEI